MTLNACLRPPKALLPLLALACVVVVLPVRAAPPPAAALPPEAAASASTALPIVLRARSLRARPDLDASAEGDVELRRGPLWLRADRLDYDVVEDLAWARGQVRVQRGDVVYRGPELQLRLDRFEGFFLQPEFDLLRLQSGGWAERVDFLGRSRALATRVAYTSCPREDAAELPWVLQADRLRMDFEANEGIAEGGVLRFMDVPILALPALSFPLTDARKSGWLPPTINLDTRSGLDLSVPYYWNLAPNRDATLTPRLITRRGFGLDSEFRYLEPGQRGELQVDLLPQDRIAGRSRHALRWQHDGEGPSGLRLAGDVERVSDDGWWRDFPGASRALTPRLLPSRLGVERDLAWGGAAGLAYARMHRWQVLQQSTDLVTPPYERGAQLGMQWQGRSAGGLEWGAQTEFNEFRLPTGPSGVVDPRSEGSRWHLIASLTRPWRGPAWWVTPRLSVNAAHYRTDLPMADGQFNASRVVPSVSLDGGVHLEREASAFGRTLRQTLEPRLHYVRTPYRAQALLPNFDAVERDFNFDSIFADNAFVGVDRVSDSHQLTGRVTTRLFDPASGAELLRLGAVQRVLLDTQRVTGSGIPLTQRWSDLLLLAGTSVLPNLALDAELQYSTEIDRLKRSVASARYFPGPYRTLSAAYRFTREQSEQLELGWQWPLRLSSPGPAAAAPGTGSSRASSAGCGGSWYGVGRLNYSLQDRRVTDAIVGLEFDAGCWIARVVAERLSTGRSESTTRLLLQLELVGLSRLGSNPLKVLRDNIPGYRLLRDEVAPAPNPPIHD